MILCVGQSTYDITIPVDNYPEENKKYKVWEVSECGGGAANNAAYLASKWKNEVYFLTSIGTDEAGMKVKDELKSVGVKLDYINEVANKKTITSYIMANKTNGSRTIITHTSKDMVYPESFTFDLKPDVILFDGNDFELAKKIALTNPSAIKIIDAGSMKENTVELSKYCDYIVCSNDFAKGYTGIDFNYSDTDKIYEVYDLIQKDFSGKLVITLESFGSITKINNEFKLVKSINVESVDSTGAGDIYHGAFTHFIAHGYSLLDTMKYSNIAGALSVTKLGSKNSMPNYEDVINYHEL